MALCGTGVPEGVRTIGRTIQTAEIPRILLHFFLHMPNMHETYQKKYRILPIFLPAESAGPYTSMQRGGGGGGGGEGATVHITEKKQQKVARHCALRSQGACRIIMVFILAQYSRGTAKPIRQLGTGGLCWHNLVVENLEHNLASSRRWEHNYTIIPQFYYVGYTIVYNAPDQCWWSAW